jgi:hypothetical protein
MKAKLYTFASKRDMLAFCKSALADLFADEYSISQEGAWYMIEVPAHNINRVSSVALACYHRF